MVPAAASSAPVPLRTALDQLATAAGVRLSYSRELLPLDRSSCLPSARAPLGVVLAQLLQGTGVQSVGVGDDQVVLAPALAAPVAPDATPVAPRAAVLEQVVVTGSATGAPSRRLPFTLDVVEGTDYGAVGTQAALPLAGTLDGHVPGLWLWAQPPTAVLARYGSLRGASSFGVSTPKLYLDGVEVANPLVVTELPAERIARVEVIRGPQGAALYGADAISGVINVVTRHDGAREGATGGRTFLARGGIGGAGSDYAGRPAVAQDYALLLRTGAGARTAGASLSASTLGAYAPGAASRRLTATGDLQRVGAAGTVSATLRLADVATSTPLDPQLSALLATQTTTTDGQPTHYDLGTSMAYAAPSNSSGSATPPSSTTTAVSAILPRQRLQQLTAGVTMTRAGGTRWTHALTAGVDAYRLSGVTTDFAPAVSLLDSAQRAARGGAARLTLRGSSTATFDLRPGVRATVLALADYGLLRDATTDGAVLAMQPPDSAMDGNGRPGGGYDDRWHGERPAGSLLAPGARNAVAYLGTAGLVGQTTLAFDDAVFLTAGLRGERNDGFTSASRFAALPSVGAAVVRAVGAAVTVKLRTAYGSGQRPARTATRATSWRGAGAFSADLTPETQRGVEAGVDLYLDGVRGGAGRGAPAVALHATRFDQEATHLLQQVTLAPPAGAWSPPTNAVDSARRGPRYLYYAVEDVGAIRNRGWEFAGDLRVGPLTLAATLSLVDSRVRRLAAGYTGDLRPGDRMLEVPRRTAGVSALWQHAGWSATFGAARASNWINYDRLALATATSNLAIPTGDVSGAALRSYWRQYPGVTRLEATAARDLRRGFTVVLSGSNLLDQQQGEPDNTTLLPGRTVTLGLRARF